MADGAGARATALGGRRGRLARVSSVRLGWMRGYPSSPRSIVYSFGPGRMTAVVKVLIWTNVALFLVSWFVPAMILYLGLQPQAVLTRLALWQLVTYMFLHDIGGPFHLVFNMLTLWMFGVELERRWGARFFARYYLVTGVGAAVVTVALALVPGEFGTGLRYSLTVGASGAIYGLLLAYGLTFPDRPIYMMLLFPIRARYFVLIMGSIELFLSIGGSQGGVANIAHLGGLIVGYLYLRGRPSNPWPEIKYRYVKWRMNRLRRRFSVHTGGRDDWDRRVH